MVQEGTNQSEALHSYAPSCSLTNQEYHSKEPTTWKVHSRYERLTSRTTKNTHQSIKTTTNTNYEEIVIAVCRDVADLERANKNISSLNVK